MFNVRLAGGHLYGKQLFTWLSLMVSLMASFVLSFFPLDVLDEIWDLIESVSEIFLTYSFIKTVQNITWLFINILNLSPDNQVWDDSGQFKLGLAIWYETPMIWGMVGWCDGAG